MLVNHLAIVPGQLTAPHHGDVVAALPRVARALQKQIDRDFGPLWGVKATISVYPTKDQVPLGCWPILVDETLRPKADSGWHWDVLGQPYARLAYDVKLRWTVTASHEALEMLADPYGEALYAAPSVDKRFPPHDVLYAVEVCDPCEGATYVIDGITVSDFITPRYYDAKPSPRARYSHTGKVRRPLQVLSGGYLSWNDPERGYSYELDRAKGRSKITVTGHVSRRRGF